MHEDGFAVQARELKKMYRTGDSYLTVLNGLDLQVRQGSIVAIVGRSGSGKSTLLHLIGGIDAPTEGSVLVRGRNVESATEEELSEFRNRYIGFIFQFHNLLSEFSVIENVMMPFLINEYRLDRAYKKGMEILRQLEMEDKKDVKPNRLSGGESQRAAIARALINEPEIVLADEPTGNLDLNTAEKIKALLFGIVKSYGHTLLIVTHNPSVVDKADETYQLEYGRLNRLAVRTD
jgi:lipoprotein-releasing system ATP-binding protein